MDPHELKLKTDVAIEKIRHKRALRAQALEDALRWFLKRELTKELDRLKDADTGFGPDGEIVDCKGPEQIEVQKLLDALEATTNELLDALGPNEEVTHGI